MTSPKYIQVPVEPADHARMCQLLQTSRSTVPQMLRREFYRHLEALEALATPHVSSQLNPNQITEYLNNHVTPYSNPRS